MENSVPCTQGHLCKQAHKHVIKGVHACLDALPKYGKSTKYRIEKSRCNFNNNYKYIDVKFSSAIQDSLIGILEFKHLHNITHHRHINKFVLNSKWNDLTCFNFLSTRKRQSDSNSNVTACSNFLVDWKQLQNLFIEPDISFKVKINTLVLSKWQKENSFFKIDLAWTKHFAKLQTK